jgi:hypothetical protein
MCIDITIYSPRQYNGWVGYGIVEHLSISYTSVDRPTSLESSSSFSLSWGGGRQVGDLCVWMRVGNRMKR